MASSLIPERPLLISPTLAATIGLEEAVMLHVISELQLQKQPVLRNQRHWINLSQADLIQALPFWKPDDIKRIQQNLLAKGLVVQEEQGSTMMTAINQTVATPATPAETPAATVSQINTPSVPQAQTPSDTKNEPGSNDIFSRSSRGRATRMSADWQPSDMLYQQCQQRQQIPRYFISERVKSFVMFQSERGNTQYSWHNAFLKWITTEWRKDQSYQGAKELESQMSAQWSPSIDAFEILEHDGIPRDYIDDSVPEFVLYWRERGLITSTWSSKFIAHVRRQWAKYSAEVEHDTTPRLIPADFEPSGAFYEVLGLANIDQDFAREQIQEFILYWQDRKEASSSWNSRFLHHVKYKWAMQAQSSLPASQQLEHTIERMTDRSWAD